MGSERSGTNLLRTRLDNHSNILGPVPVHTMAWFYNFEPYYGNLQKDKNFNTLVDDIIKSVEVNIYKWDIDFDCETIKNEIPKSKRSVIHLFGYIHDKYAEKKGKKRWFCKDNDLVEYAWPLNNYFPKCKFIYLVRDPRDVCLSNLRRAGGPNTAYNFSLVWMEEQKRCIRVFTEEVFNEKIFLVKYEEILGEPEKTFKKICKFLGEKFEPEMIKGKDRKEAGTTNAWKNLSKDIMQNNMKKYLDGLTEKQIKIIEKITAREMDFLGYEFEYKENDYSTNLMKTGFYKTLDEFKSLLNYDTQKEWEKRKKRNRLRKSIKNRWKKIDKM